MRIAILGFAGQGQSAYEYWNREGNELTICDRDTGITIPENANANLGEDYLQNLNQFDVLIRTPALHPQEIVNANNSQILDKVWSNTNEFLKICPTKNVIGVTGTKGKGTTSTLIAKILEAAGKQVYLGGNIGTPPLDLFKNDIKPDDWVVLELANFQLIDLRISPHIAVCLMVVPEHMDWHQNFEEYFAAKQQLFTRQTEADLAIYFADNENSVNIACVSVATRIPYFDSPGAVVANGKITINEQVICNISDLKLLGKHNWQNVCAAITVVWQITQDIKAIQSVVTSFSGLEHRLQFVRELNGVKYYNDSFGTTPETAIVAIEAFDSPKVVILGGSDKGAAYDQLAQAVKNGHVRHVLLIGDTAQAIGEALKTAGFEAYSPGGTTMHEMVNKAGSLAKSGDIVLLSTGCASFGLFNNYKDRGEQFNQAVLALV